MPFYLFSAIKKNEGCLQHGFAIAPVKEKGKNKLILSQNSLFANFLLLLVFVDALGKHALGKHPLCHRMCKVTKETSGANNIMRNAIDSTLITFRWTSSRSRQSVFSTTTIAKKTEENGSQSRKSDYLFKIGPWTSEPLLR